jgi:hypothetical protein
MKRVPQTQFGSKRKQNEMRDHEKSSCVDGKKRKKNTTRCTDKAHAAVSGSSFVNFDKNCHRADSADNCGDYAVLNGRVRVPFVGLKMSHLDEYSIGFFDGDDQTTTRRRHRVMENAIARTARVHEGSPAASCMKFRESKRLIGTSDGDRARTR